MVRLSLASISAAFAKSMQVRARNAFREIEYRAVAVLSEAARRQRIDQSIAEGRRAIEAAQGANKDARLVETRAMRERQEAEMRRYSIPQPSVVSAVHVTPDLSAERAAAIERAERLKAEGKARQPRKYWLADPDDVAALNAMDGADRLKIAREHRIL